MTKDLDQLWRLGEEDEEDICDITNEIIHLGEAKDIRDELKMIERVLQDQATVVARYRASRNGNLPPDVVDRLTTLEQNFESRIYKIERLDREALSVENSVIGIPPLVLRHVLTCSQLNHLSDLKPKQANLDEARDTRLLVNEAGDRARAGEKHNQLLFIFTLVTFVFIGHS